jgi:malate dehydrogenase
VLVVGNPANTNAWILAEHAPGFDRENIGSMIRLDHNRAAGQLAAKAGVGVGEISKLAVWGNHSPTMFADWTYATAGGESLPAKIGDTAWYADTLIPAWPSAARRLSRRAVHPRQPRRPMRRWTICATGCSVRTESGCRWVSPRPANTTFPRADLRRARHLHPGAIERVGGLELDDFQHRMIQHSVSELVEERDAVVRLLAE